MSTKYLVGGLVGVNGGRGTISRSFAVVDVNAPDTQIVGGLVGESNSAVVKSYAVGAVIGGEKTKTGGLIGSMTLGARVADSYAIGSVSGGALAHIGGLVGDVEDAVGVATTYSTGEIIGGMDGTRGGFVGAAHESSFIKDYWDIDTSGDDRGSGSGCRKDCKANITGLTTEQLTSELPAGFDPSIWAQNSKINNGYPYLINSPPR